MTRNAARVATAWVFMGSMLIFCTLWCGAEDAPVAGVTRTFAEMEFVWIPPGSFTMGSEGFRESERPAHLVTLTNGFWLGKYEVTKAQWLAVMESEPWAGRERVVDDPDSPAEFLTWHDAQDFVAVLNALGEGVFRLPTEAEWEYACRAGSASQYCFGDGSSALEEFAWFGEGLEGRVRVVGQKEPNAWGLYDIHGNVWEWCQDWYSEQYTDAGPVTDPTGAEKGMVRVFRGGSFGDEPELCRSSMRNGGVPWAAWNWTGLRLVRSDGPGLPKGDRAAVLADVRRQAAERAEARSKPPPQQHRHVPKVQVATPEETALVEAAGNGDEAEVKCLIDKGVAIDALAFVRPPGAPYSLRRMTPLTNAIEAGHDEMALSLLELGASPFTGAQTGTPLDAAAGKGNLMMVKRLQAAGAEPTVDTLLKACKTGTLDVVELLLEQGFSVEASNDGDQTPLLAAVVNPDAEIARILLERGANPNRVTRYGTTPLLAAAQSVGGHAGGGDSSVFEALLEYGADPNVTSGNRKETALHIVAYWGTVDVIETLLRHGADPNARDGGDYTAADLACKHGRVEEKLRVIESYGGKRSFRMPWIPILVVVFLLAWTPFSLIPLRRRGGGDKPLPGTRSARVVSRAHLRLCALVFVFSGLTVAGEKGLLDELPVVNLLFLRLASHEQIRATGVMFFAGITCTVLQAIAMIVLQFLKPSRRQRWTAIGVGSVLAILVLAACGLMVLGLMALSG